MSRRFPAGDRGNSVVGMGTARAKALRLECAWHIQETVLCRPLCGSWM